MSKVRIGNTIVDGEIDLDTTSNIPNNITFTKEQDHFIEVEDSTTVGSDGGDLDVRSARGADGDGSNAGGAGGTLRMKAGGSGDDNGAGTQKPGGFIGEAGDAGVGSDGGDAELLATDGNGPGTSGGVSSVRSGLDGDGVTRRWAELTKAYLLGAQRMSRHAVLDINYVASQQDFLISYSVLSAARQVTLPTPVVGEHRFFRVKDETGNAGTNNITVVGASGETFDGNPSFVIDVAYGEATFYTDGNDYFVLDRFTGSSSLPVATTSSLGAVKLNQTPADALNPVAVNLDTNLAVVIDPPTTGTGLDATGGPGSGTGIRGTGGAGGAGVGVVGVGGPGNGKGVTGDGNGTGAGGVFTGLGTGPGVRGISTSENNGVEGQGGFNGLAGGYFLGGDNTGGALGFGVYAVGGIASGVGGYFEGGTANGDGVQAKGTGTGTGAKALAGTGSGNYALALDLRPNDNSVTPASVIQAKMSGWFELNGFQTTNDDGLGTPGLKRLVTPKNVEAIWALLEGTNGVSVQIVDSYNVNGVSIAGGASTVVTITFAVPMADTDYIVDIFNDLSGTGSPLVFFPTAKTTTSVSFQGINLTSLAAADLRLNLQRYGVRIMGRQVTTSN